MDIAEVCKLLQVKEELVQEALTSLAVYYETQRRGIRIQRLGTQVQLTSAPENARYIAALLGMPTQAKLTNPALETLAIIAYRQPITRAQLEAIRTVNSDRALATLTQHGLVMEVGRAATVGRPALFGTTLEFLQQFGLMSIDALPSPDATDELAQRRARDGRNVRHALTRSDSDTKTPVPLHTPDVVE